MALDSDEASSGLVEQKTTKLQPRALKEIKAVSQYAISQENKMEKLTNDVDKMGKLKCIWDSKVPEMNKRFYYFFSLKESKPKEIKEDIQKYLKFYEQLKDVVLKISNDKEMPEGIDIKILDLYESLAELAKAADTGKETTASSTVCDLHKEFISKHDKLEYMIKRAECVSLKQSLKKTTEDLQQSLKAIDELRDDVKASNSKFDNLCDKFDELLIQNKKLMKQQNVLLEENVKMMQQQQTLMEDNKKMKEQTDLLIGAIALIAAEKGNQNTNNEN